MWADEKNADEESSSTSEPAPEANASETADESPAPEENAPETADESPAPPVEEAEQSAQNNGQMRALVLFGGAAALLLIVWGILMWSRPKPETLDGFIGRWNGVVLLPTEEAAEEQFEKLLLKSAVSSGLSRTTGVDLIKTLREDGGVLLEPSDGQLLDEEERLSVLAVQTPDPEDENAAELTFQLDADGPEYTLYVERGGWARQWRISNLAAQTPGIELEPSAVVETPDPMDAEPFIETAEAVQEEGAPIDTQLKLRQILKAWQTAWERRDVEDYIKWYADFAEIVRVTVVEGSEIREPLTVAQLSARMKRLAEKYSDIDIKISNLSIQGDRAEADLQFNQTYKAYRDAEGQNEIAYTDEGRKTLKFVVDDNGDWRIYHESWTTYIQVPSFPLD